MYLSKNLLIIGGTGRNVGKTTLANLLIKKFSLQIEIIGLKVSTHKKGDEFLHGYHEVKIDEASFSIKKEDGEFPLKDTAKMLAYGASCAYYIETPKESVIEAYHQFNTLYNKANYPVVCESRSLMKYILPGIYILIIGEDNKDRTYKNLTDDELNKADIIVYSKDGITGLIGTLNRIKIVDNEWQLI